MDLDNYTKDTEDIVVESSAYEGKDAISNDKKGTLACTTNRLVFTRDKKVVDISLNAINSVEYKLPSYPEEYLNYGLIELLIGLILYSLSDRIPMGIGEELGLFVIVIAGITFILGLLFRRRVLYLHTPNKTYSFATKDASIEQIAHAVRGYEQKH
ncbi:hypothetical protein [Halostella sp. PRR32]|uniref:hypothetical protein n=1 Tax=Halostella sp. PRR32 TaxID=3098147 RepID=UPI002B1DD3B7|nr:hypothetical protein [Halostella sp. PRR32]